MRNLYKKFFYIPKHEKVTEKVFLTRTTLSVLSILVCLIILCSATLAYFNSTKTSNVDTIVTATYDLTITAGDGVSAVDADTYSCSGNSDNIYTFTLNASGNAEKGYCKIYVTGDANSPYFTHQIDRGSVSIQVKAADGTTIRFEPCWGTSSVYAAGGVTYGTGDVIVCTGGENLTDAPIETEDYILHTVSDGQTLVSIAELYQIPITAICEYNEIAEDTILSVGQQIAIRKKYTIEDDPAGEGSETGTTSETEPAAPSETVVTETEPAAPSETVVTETKPAASSENVAPETEPAVPSETVAPKAEPTAPSETTEPTESISSGDADPEVTEGTSEQK